MGDRKRSVRKPRAVLADAERLQAVARAVIDDHRNAVAQVTEVVAGLRDRLVGDELAAIPVARLRDVTDGRLRVGALEAAGLSTVRHIVEASAYSLQLLPGIGAQTASQAIAAARQIAEAVGQAVSVRLDIDHRDRVSTALVIALQRLVVAGPEAVRAAEIAQRTVGEVDTLVATAQPARGAIRGLLAGRRRKQEAFAAIEQLTVLLAELETEAVPLLFAQASADLLRSCGLRDRGMDGLRAPFGRVLRCARRHRRNRSGRGERFRGLPSRGTLRPGAGRAAGRHAVQGLARGYQAFGARFALRQKRVIIGDEMGLGKTVQAIAAMAHLRTRGSTHFLVVCPASVLINWTREIESRSTLCAHRFHGQEREAARTEWLRNGGVAVATFDGLRRLEVPPDLAVGMFVVDEAHYVKNHEAQRSRAVAAWTDRVERVLPDRYSDGEPG